MSEYLDPYRSHKVSMYVTGRRPKTIIIPIIMYSSLSRTHKNTGRTKFSVPTIHCLNNKVVHSTDAWRVKKDINFNINDNKQRANAWIAT